MYFLFMIFENVRATYKLPPILPKSLESKKCRENAFLFFLDSHNKPLI